MRGFFVLFFRTLLLVFKIIESLQCMFKDSLTNNGKNGKLLSRFFSVFYLISFYKNHDVKLTTYGAIDLLNKSLHLPCSLTHLVISVILVLLFY